ncbi:NAD(P)H-hydrate dehydratase [Fictibacillus fluitans]|uniref:Bifunctional NAD(P)H-hydrate repair enzyme n=1 Tax=Fictibacillus fluitans TaxID=3058422 RepID=A0ABT8HW84_9BACL|nr:NAD(P)H-hydrate dehydratase [Fictibacillus sp. NE201]MDN4524522.1 NAD(P)H-hydrate dehydratase [Fictibacillus sp. NE201]
MHIFTGAEIKQIDQIAQKSGLDVFTLMENAGRALFEEMKKHIGKKDRILIMSGKGNNGGDGIVLARYLQQHGYSCELVLPAGKPKSETALKHFTHYTSCGLKVSEIQGKYDVIVDALLGAGATPPLQGEIQKVIHWANEQHALKIAVDLPTGVSADEGWADEAFQANYTYCLHGYKPSAFLEGSTDYYGEKKVLGIGLPQESKWQVWTEEHVKRTFQKREQKAHKGTFGTGLLLAGSDEMPGSALLAGIGALRSGIGKLTIGTSRFVAGVLAGRIPEAMYAHDGLQKVVNGQVPKGMKACAIGPGLPNPEEIEQALKVLFQSDLPLIIDAGALQERRYPSRKAEIILTPHPGEFSKMTGIPVPDIQKNRLYFAQKYAQEQGVITVLKGRNTVIAFPDGDLFVNETGNAGLAKGGTGDTLTGMLLAFVSAEKDIKSAVANAVYFHGCSADHWGKTKAQRGLLASDVSELLPDIMKSFE